MKPQDKESKATETGEKKPVERRPYEKPGFLTSMAFERASLACGAPKNTVPGLCAMQS